MEVNRVIPFHINPRVLSELVWRELFDGLSLVERDNFNRFNKEIRGLDRLREYAQYNTGSISALGSLACFALSSRLQPKIIAEVGTFIGRSIISLGLGSLSNGQKSVECYTCDMYNNIKISDIEGIHIHQYMLKESTEMFKDLQQKEIKPDLIHLDGLLFPQDIELLKTISKENTTYLLDDFEGIDKGISNAIMLQPLLGHTHYLLYPPQRIWLAKGIVDRYNGETSCGMYIPKSLFVYE